jgi:hypothetical protein
MKKEKLEEYVGKRVTVTLFNGDTYTGKLRKTGTEDLRDENTYLFCVRDKYFIEMNYDISPCFRYSHIKKLKEADNEK